MKVRKSSIESKKTIVDKKENNFKERYQKKVKIKENLNETSYCDSHNIGKRKSNASVVTYSLNSHLFFDVYAKFDLNDRNRLNGANKPLRKSRCNDSKSTIPKKFICQSPVSDDASTDAMSNHDCPSNPSSPKLLKVLCEAQPVNQDETLIPSPQIARILPFRSPRKTRVSLSKLVDTQLLSATEIHSNSFEVPQTNTETFQKILENKTVFKKHLSTVSLLKNTASKLKTQIKVQRRVSTRLSNLADQHQNVAGKPLVPLNGIAASSCPKRCSRLADSKNIVGICRQKRMASLNAAAIINCVQSLFSDKRKRRELAKEIVCDEEEIMLELDSNCGDNELLVDETKVKELTLVKREKELVKEEKDKSRNESELECLSLRRGKRKVTKEIRYCSKIVRRRRMTKKEANDPSEIENRDTMWLWDGEGREKVIELNGVAQTRVCYPAVRHAQDDVVICVMDCVLLRSVDQQQPYLAKIIAFFDDLESNRKMMAILWYYQPEHTDHGRQSWHTEADVYASRHADINCVDCIEDKAFVLPPELFCRFMAQEKLQESSTKESLSARIVPMMIDDDMVDVVDMRPGWTDLSVGIFSSNCYLSPHFQTSFPPELSASNVFVCRGLYDIKQHKVMKSILPLAQSPVRELMERCPSIDSAMSISSSNSRLNHTPLHSVTSATITTSLDHDHASSPKPSFKDYSATVVTCHSPSSSSPIDRSKLLAPLSHRPVINGNYVPTTVITTATIREHRHSL